MSIDHAVLSARVRRGILMVVIVAPLKLYGFIPHSLLRRRKIANPKSVIPACFERESRRIRIRTPDKNIRG
jgi:hypothetical protein